MPRNGASNILVPRERLAEIETRLQASKFLFSLSRCPINIEICPARKSRLSRSFRVIEKSFHENDLDWEITSNKIIEQLEDLRIFIFIYSNECGLTFLWAQLKIL